MSIDAARSLWFLERFVAVKRAMSLAGWRALAGLKMGPGQVRLMREIARSAPVPQGELARRIEMDPSATSRAVNSLIKLGLLRRRRCADDRREMLVELTAEGRRASRRIDRAWQRMASVLTRDLDEKDLAAFDRVAAKLISPRT